MTNDDSYKMMEAMRRHLGRQGVYWVYNEFYETGKTTEIVLTFKTNDGKVHQLCNSFKENKNGSNSN